MLAIAAGICVGATISCSETPPTGPLTPSDAATVSTKEKGARYSMLAISSQSVCGLEKKGQVYCWGLNNYGQLGDGTTDLFSAVPRPIASAEKFKQVAHSYTHGCALTNDGRVFCWGANESGQLGSAAALITRAPTPVTGGTFSTIAVGSWHTCAISSGLLDFGRAYCWGANAAGQLGVEGNGNFSAPTPVYSRGLGQDITTRPLSMYAVHAGIASTCALQEGLTALGTPTGFPGRWVCWGYSAWGLFGGVYANVSVPVPELQFDGLEPLTIRPSRTWAEHLCVIARDPSNNTINRAYCAGRNTDGQYGDGTDTTVIGIRDTTTGVRMTEVSGGTAFTEISTGDNHTCALKGDGTPFCWGANDLGQLGTGNTAPSLVPVPVATSLRFAKIYAANRYTCALTSQGEAYCWGRNELGELGDGAPVTYRPLPTRVAEP